MLCEPLTFERTSVDSISIKTSTNIYIGYFIRLPETAQHQALEQGPTAHKFIWKYEPTKHTLIDMCALADIQCQLIKLNVEEQQKCH